MKDTKSNRDESVDRLLAGTLKARAANLRDDACLDAETLAAWADEALDARERAVAEAHAADCPRCHALLAAMVRTQPAPVVTASPWRMPALGWLVPVAAAATALAIWVAVPNREPVQMSDGGAEPVEQVSPARAAAPPAAASRPQADVQAKVKAGENPPPDARERQQADALKKQTPPAAPVSADALSATSSNVAQTPAAAPAAPPAPAESAAAGSALRRSAADASVRSDALASGRVPAFANSMETVIVSSNPATRFRLLRGGDVQRSADAGATWRTETTGATDPLTAGASPSPSVCWLVGRAGTVLLSTDGRSWRRVAFPEAVDLRSVTASDGENATVTTAEGRAFVTTDAGQTWTRAPA